MLMPEIRLLNKKYESKEGNSCGINFIPNFITLAGIYSCGSKFVPVAGILFLWREFHSCDRNSFFRSFLWQEFYSCCRNFIPVTGILFLRQEYYSWGRNFIPVEGISCLWQEFYSCDRNLIPVVGIYSCCRNFIPVVKCDVNSWIWVQISCHILLISCGQCPRVHGEKNGLH